MKWLSQVHIIRFQIIQIHIYQIHIMWIRALPDEINEKICEEDLTNISSIIYLIFVTNKFKMNYLPKEILNNYIAINDVTNESINDILKN